MAQADEIQKREREWEPIIGDLPIEHPSGKVTFGGSELYVNGHLYYHGIAEYLPPTGPVLTKAGRVAKKQPPKPRKQPHTWWKAQCAFRGLSPKGSIAQLQDRLRGHEMAPICKEFIDLKERAKKEWRVKNNQAGEDKWNREMSGDEKALADPRSYLLETFPAGGTTPEPVVIRGNRFSGRNWALGIQRMAKELGLVAGIVEVEELDPNYFGVVDRRWVIVGREKAAVAEAARPILETMEQRKVEKQRRRDAIKRREEALAKQQQQKLREALDKCEDWDVEGTYKISCPYITTNWRRVQGDDMTLKVYRKRTPKGSQMYAAFDFGIVSGVFRFERHESDPEPLKSNRGESNKRKREEEDSEDEYGDYKRKREENSEDEYDDYYGRRSPTPEAFYLGSIPRPSAEYRSWHYRWRGEDTGSGHIQTYSDERRYTIKWDGPRVEKLEGTFGGDFLEDCTFTGVKIGVGAELRDLDIAEEWSRLVYE